MTENLDPNLASSANYSDNLEQSVIPENTSKENLLGDISKHAKPELLELFKKIIGQGNPIAIKNDVEQIKSLFYKLHREQNEALKNKFIESGEKAEHFSPPSDPIEVSFKSLLKSFKEAKANFIKFEEQKKQENLALKLEIIESIKALSEKEETLNKSFEEYKELQEKWRNTGNVPSQDAKNLWESYHLACEVFYNYVNINKELRDLDFKKNAEAKTKLIEAAQALDQRKDIVSAFRELQELHERWREIGPTKIEDKEQLWNNFKELSSKINKKHHAYFDERKKQLVDNFELRSKVCENIESVDTSKLNTHKDWDREASRIKALQVDWKKMGPVAKTNLSVFERFRKASDDFFEKKKAFYNDLKGVQKDNIAKKKALCEQVEAIPHEENWKEHTQSIINLQKQWKKTGPVAKKQNDVLWERFRKACDAFFAAKDHYFENIDSIYADNLKQKEGILEKLNLIDLTQNSDTAIEQINKLLQQWDQIGFVDKKNKEAIQNKLQKKLNEVYQKLGLDPQTQTRVAFENKIKCWLEAQDGARKLSQEYDRLRKKLNTVSSDLNLLENNIGFFNISKGNDKMMNDFTQKIDQAKEHKIQLEQKIRTIKKYLK